LRKRHPSGGNGWNPVYQDEKVIQCYEALAGIPAISNGNRLYPPDDVIWIRRGEGVTVPHVTLPSKDRVEGNCAAVDCGMAVPTQN
jgi:hypothetical protein